ncbi:MAG: vitamin K epoxide reductase family protein [Patescibacteria group bacterium]
MSKSYSYIIIACGFVGLMASFLLTVNIIELTKDSSVNLPCNINPFISCTSIINSSQGNIFGFPNPLLGIAGFSFVLATGALTLFGAVPSIKFWKIFTIGTTLAILLVHWFIYQSIFVLGSLCLYCMVTWSATWPIFLFTINQLFKADDSVGSPTFMRRGFQSFQKNHLAFLVSWYLLIIFLIFFRFREYFLN